MVKKTQENVTRFKEVSRQPLTNTVANKYVLLQSLWTLFKTQFLLFVDTMGLKHAARQMCLCGQRLHQNTVNCTLNNGLRHFLAPIRARGDIFSPYAARELFFLQNVTLV